MRVGAAGAVEAAKPIKEGLSQQQTNDLLAAVGAQEVGGRVTGPACTATAASAPAAVCADALDPYCIQCHRSLSLRLPSLR